MTTIDLTTTATRPGTPRPTRLERVRWASGPLALVVGPALAIAGFALHPRAMGDREFVAWTNLHATQFAVAHLLIGFGLAIAAVGVWSVLRLAHGRRGTVLVAGTVAMFVGTVGMGYDHLAHGALGYALASDSTVPLGMSTHVQVGFETLPYVGWAGLASAFFPLGCLLLGIGALLSRRVPTWGAVLLLLGPVGIMVAGAGPFELLGAAPLMIGFATVARAAWKTQPVV